MRKGRLLGVVLLMTGCAVTDTLAQDCTPTPPVVAIMENQRLGYGSSATHCATICLNNARYASHASVTLRSVPSMVKLYIGL
jgi:hypothetical protein